MRSDYQLHLGVVSILNGKDCCGGQVTETSLRQVLDVMGLDEFVELTNDIGIAHAVLALRSKLKSNAWVRGMAKYRQLPVFAIKVLWTIVFTSISSIVLVLWTCHIQHNSSSVVNITRMCMLLMHNVFIAGKHNGPNG